MPYPGVPKEKTAAMERCVEKVLAQHKGEKDFGKSNAIAICHKSIMGNEQDTKGGLALEPITAEDLAQYGNHALLAQVELGELMKFKNAHLCSIGENANKDWIDESGIKELAATMSFMAIDDEHDEQKVVGFFVNPRGADNFTKLYTDGVIYARRFDDVARQVQSGEKKLSVEAGAQRAECSVCGGVFASVSEYCEHLRDKYKYDATRRLSGLKAKGGATVRYPAWDTSFDPNGFTMIASRVEMDRPKTDAERAKTHFEISDEDWNKLSNKERQGYISKLPPVGTKRANEAEASLWERIETKLDAYLQRFKPVLIAEELDKTKGGATMSEVNVDELNLEELGLVQASELDTLKADLEAKLAEKETDIEKLKIGFARVLEMGMEASQLEILADMSEDAYQLLKTQQEKPKEVKVEAKVEVKEEGPEPKKETVLEGGEIKPDVPLTWETAPGVLNLKKEV